MADEMELGDFIENALVQIANGVRGANDIVTARDGQRVDVFSLMRTKGDAGKTVASVRFDVAVSVSSETKGGARLSVLPFPAVGVGVGGERRSGDESLHRIQFEVGLKGDLT